MSDEKVEIKAATDEQRAKWKQYMENLARDMWPLEEMILALDARIEQEQERAVQAETILARIIKATPHSMCFDAEAWAEAESIMESPDE